MPRRRLVTFRVVLIQKMDVELLNTNLRAIIREIVSILAQHIESEILIEMNRPKRIWERKWIARRKKRGTSSNLLMELSVEDTVEYRYALRMSEPSFLFLLDKITPTVQRSDMFMRCALSAKLKLQIVLYMLANGTSLHMFRTSKASISTMIPEVCDAIYEALKDYIQVPSDENLWNKIEEGFKNKLNFPRCCGAIDRKHIIIKAPFEAGSYYYKYKHQNSIVLMAVVDDDYSFSYIDVGCNGRVSDGGVFQRCSLSNRLESMLPKNHCIVGDNAFPLKTYLMKPYGDGSNMTTAQKVFNYRLSRARRIVENAFGILVSRFRIFEKPLPFPPDKVIKIVKACCALHNWLRYLKNVDDSVTIDEEDINAGQTILGNWREVPSDGLISLPRSSNNHSAERARIVRDNYATYFVGNGSGSWWFNLE